MRRAVGAFEYAQILTDRFAPFNVVIALRLDGNIDPEKLRQALPRLQSRHPLLGVHLVEASGNFAFETEGTPTIPLELCERRDDRQWMEIIEEELNRPLDTTRGPLMRLRALLSPRHDSAKTDIIVTFHHAILDQRSALAFVGELLIACDPKAASLPSMSAAECLPPPAEEYFPLAHLGLRGIWRRAGFLLRQAIDEVFYRLRSSDALSPDLDRQSQCKILPVKLSRDETATLIKASRRQRVTVNSVLLAALLLAVSEHLYGGRNRPMRYMTFADIRPYLEPPAESLPLAAYHSVLRFTIPVRGDADLWELARDINTQVLGGARRGDKFTSFLMTPWMMKTVLRLQNARMGTAAVSYGGVVRLVEPTHGIRIEEFHAFVSNLVLGPAYTGTARLWAGELWWDVVYLESDMDRTKAAAIADSILDRLKQEG